MKHPPPDRPGSDEHRYVSRETHTGAVQGDLKGSAVRLATLLEELGETWGQPQVDQLRRYGRWLQEEAIPAGGLGPAEGPRIFERHLADSLMYLRGLPAGMPAVVDVGSGVGLPGVPLAIARPQIQVTILDRAARRTRLAQRVVRILRLDNVEVITQDVREFERMPDQRRFDAAVFRASLPVARAAEVFPTLTRPSGVGLVGVSRLEETPDIPEPPSGVHFALTAETSEVLDSPFWLLRMRTT